MDLRTIPVKVRSNKLQIFSPHQHFSTNSSWAWINEARETRRGTQQNRAIEPKAKLKKIEPQIRNSTQTFANSIPISKLVLELKKNNNLISLMLKINNEIWMNETRLNLKKIETTRSSTLYYYANLLSHCC